MIEACGVALVNAPMPPHAPEGPEDPATAHQSPKSPLLPFSPSKRAGDPVRRVLEAITIAREFRDQNDVTLTSLCLMFNISLVSASYAQKSDIRVLMFKR